MKFPLADYAQTTMKTNATILVATDLGVAGDQAIETGDAWRKRYDGKMIVLHVTAQAKQHDEAHARLLERVRAHTRDERAEVRVVDGASADRILAVAEEVSADLIVLGGREASGTRWIFGAVAERVVSRAHVPVLVARPDGASPPHILAATDFSEPSLPAVAAAHEIAKRFAAPVTIVHCIEPEAEYSALSAVANHEGADTETISAARARLREICEHSEEHDTSRVVVGEPAASIVKLADQLPASLIVVASRGRSGVARMVLGSVAARLSRDARCSVLVVRLHE